MQQPSRKQGGFTLVEIAIVLVIIGLLLGGVLKGQEMIENGKVKNGVADLNGVTAAYNAYVDRFRRIPGDDGPIAALKARGTNWASVTLEGNVNGVLLVAAAQTFSGAGENAGFWQHLKAAGFISGNPGDAGAAALPQNAFGGLTGITTAAVQGNPAGNKVCMSRVPGKSARAIDVQIDDGQPNGGAVRATLGAGNGHTNPGVVAATYSEDNFYTICRNM